MRIRIPIALALVVASLGFLYLGLADLKLPYDKAMHFGAFFLLTNLFYWSFDLPRRRMISVTFIVCTLLGGVISEIAQGYLAPTRQFDSKDIAANIAGSLIALGLSSFYHRRMLERRRNARYQRLRSSLDGEVEAQVGSTEIELNQVANEPVKPSNGTSTEPPTL